MDQYENGLNQAKKIMAYAAQFEFGEGASDLYEGWSFLNFLVREAEKDYEEYKRSLR
jgi:hypothetical protein